MTAFAIEIEKILIFFSLIWRWSFEKTFETDNISQYFFLILLDLIHFVADEISLHELCVGEFGVQEAQ